jgi:peptidoglycan/xylan/chitin deacetylase (PgdA/CDA1 family)
MGLFWAAQLVQGQPRQVCITIDDLPCTNCGDQQQALAINRKLLQTIQLYKVPAIGFVNEGRLYTHNKPDPTKVAVLRQWLDQGLELGNHTYSHIEINRASLAEYEQDVVKGEQISRPLLAQYGKELRYFRHPQLRTGPTADYKRQLDSLLRKHGYVTAPITMDNDDYIYAYCYDRASQRKDSLSMRLIASAYLSYMQQIVAHFERLSQEGLGYEVKQILLLHASQLNADHLQPLLNLFTDRGYRFVSLTEALTDKAYSLPEVHSPKGISWLERWLLAQGKAPNTQPAVSDDIMARFRADQATR